jgi:hypothetical protein
MPLSWVGPEAWQPWLFPRRAPDLLAASGGFVWMMSGDQLLRFDGETFNEVPHELNAQPEVMIAYAGGVWLVNGGRACHHAVAPQIRVEGIRPYARSPELLYSFSVVTPDPSATVSADVNGEPVDLTWDDELAAHTGQARLDYAGWHELNIAASALGVDGTRSLLVKRLPETSRSWEVDILPIYEDNCTAADCHQAGATAQPDLSTYEAWLSWADDIRTRVVEAQSMPPPASRGPDWGDDKVQIIAEWLEGGMNP